MKSKIMPLLLIVGLFAGNGSLVCAQQTASTSDWAVVKGIPTNTRLLVKQKKGKDVTGDMIEATDTALTIDHNGKPISFARADVRQIYRITGKAAKGKWAAIGAAIGAGSGAAIGATKYSSDRDDSEIYPAMGLLLGTGAGAVGGLLFGLAHRQRELIYGAY